MICIEMKKMLKMRTNVGVSKNLLFGVSKNLLFIFFVRN